MRCVTCPDCVMEVMELGFVLSSPHKEVKMLLGGVRAAGLVAVGFH